MWSQSALRRCVAAFVVLLCAVMTHGETTPTLWFSENAASFETNPEGAWVCPDGAAEVVGDTIRMHSDYTNGEEVVYTPTNPSDSGLVTVETTVNFPAVLDELDVPTGGGQAGVQIAVSEDGLTPVFAVLDRSGDGEGAWVRTATPATPGLDYRIRIEFRYGAVKSVRYLCRTDDVSAYAEIATLGLGSAPMDVSQVAFGGTGSFTNLTGYCAELPVNRATIESDTAWSAIVWNDGSGFLDDAGVELTIANDAVLTLDRDIGNLPSLEFLGERPVRLAVTAAQSGLLVVPAGRTYVLVGSGSIAVPAQWNGAVVVLGTLAVEGSLQIGAFTLGDGATLVPSTNGLLSAVSSFVQSGGFTVDCAAFTNLSATESVLVAVPDETAVTLADVKLSGAGFWVPAVSDGALRAFKRDYSRWDDGEILTWVAGESAADLAFDVYDAVNGCDSGVLVGGEAFTSTGKVLRVSSAREGGFTFASGPLVLSGLIVEPGPVRRSVASGASGADTFLSGLFAVDDDFTLRADDGVTVRDSAAFEVANGKALTVSSSAVTLDGLSDAVLALSGGGALKVSLLDASERVTLDLSALAANRASPFVDGALSVGRLTAFAFPSALGENTAFKLCSGTLTVPSPDVAHAVTVGGESFYAMLTFDTAAKTVRYAKLADGDWNTATVSGSNDWSSISWNGGWKDGKPVRLALADDATLVFDGVPVVAGLEISGAHNADLVFVVTPELGRVDLAADTTCRFVIPATSDFPFGERLRIRTGETYVFEGAHAADLVANDGALVVRSGATLILEAGCEGTISVGEGGTLKLRLAAAQAVDGYEAGGVTLAAGENVIFILPDGSEVVGAGNRFGGSAFRWIGADGDWDAGANWNAGHAPGATNEVIVDKSVRISVTENSVCARLVIGDIRANDRTEVTLAVPNGMTMNLGGVSGNGILTKVDNGELVFRNAEDGSPALSDVRLVVDGGTVTLRSDDLSDPVRLTNPVFEFLAGRLTNRGDLSVKGTLTLVNTNELPVSVFDGESSFSTAIVCAKIVKRGSGTMVLGSGVSASMIEVEDADGALGFGASAPSEISGVVSGAGGLLVMNGSTVALQAEPTYRGLTEIDADARLEVVSKMSSAAIVGEGTLALCGWSGKLPTYAGLTDADWRGTFEFNGVRGAVADVSAEMQNFGNAGSALRFAGFEGDLAPGSAVFDAVEITGPLSLAGNHSGGETIDFVCTRLSGEGNVESALACAANRAGAIRFITADALGYSGSVGVSGGYRVAFVADDTADLSATAASSIYVGADAAVRIGPNGVWSAPGGIVVHGLVVNDGRVANKVSGTGAVRYPETPADRTVAGYTDAAAWNGTVWIRGDSESGFQMNGFNFDLYANENSKVRLTNVLGFGPNATLKTCAFPIELEDDPAGTLPALTLNNGYSGRTFEFAKLSGGGTFQDAKAGVNQRYHILDADDFTGSLKTLAKAITIGGGDNTTAGRIVVSEEATAIIASNKTWSAAAGLQVDGTLAGSHGEFVGQVDFSDGATRDGTELTVSSATFGNALHASPRVQPGDVIVRRKFDDAALDHEVAVDIPEAEYDFRLDTVTNGYRVVHGGRLPEIKLELTGSIVSNNGETAQLKVTGVLTILDWGDYDGYSITDMFMPYISYNDGSSWAKAETFSEKTTDSAYVAFRRLDAKELSNVIDYQVRIYWWPNANYEQRNVFAFAGASTIGVGTNWVSATAENFGDFSSGGVWSYNGGLSVRDGAIEIDATNDTDDVCYVVLSEPESAGYTAQVSLDLKLQANVPFRVEAVSYDYLTDPLQAGVRLVPAGDGYRLQVLSSNVWTDATCPTEVKPDEYHNYIFLVDYKRKTVRYYIDGRAVVGADGSFLFQSGSAAYATGTQSDYFDLFRFFGVASILKMEVEYWDSGFKSYDPGADVPTPGIGKLERLDDRVEITVTNAVSTCAYGIVEADSLKTLSIATLEDVFGWVAPAVDGEVVLTIERESSDKERFYKVVAKRLDLETGK